MGKRVQNKEQIAARRALHKQQKKRKKYAVIIVAAIFVSVIIVVSFIASLPHYVKIEEADGKFTDTETKITYLSAPENYEPVSYTQSAYGKLDRHYVYPITGKSTDEWLMVNFFGMLRVLYNEKISLPSLENFSPDRIQVCKDGASGIVRLADIQNQDEVSHIIDAVLNDKTSEEPNSPGTVVYTMRISSQEYPWLYYNVKYIVYDEGEFYYDSLTNRFVKADNTVYEYLFGNESETDASTDKITETQASSETASDTSTEANAK